jgi:gamma-glutamylcyclotransferase (GGCT)/AIG2-like uncharacterized protein YtfP
MAKEINKVFVYGTLKVGGFFGEKFNNVRISSVPATVKGTLFHVPAMFPSSFPGLKLAGDGVVHGELHAFDRIDDVIRAIDRIEQYFEDYPEESMYVRKKMDVETAEGTEKAYVYEYNGSTKGFKIVVDGDWKLT